ncbi:bifunctional DNA primase/polymerase [Lactovum odontotermitis]
MALEYQRQGFSIIPLAVGSKIPQAGFNFRNRADLTAEEIKQIWSAEPYNIAIRTRGLLVLDIDSARGHGLSVDGFESIQPYKEMIQDTRLVMSPTGGFHAYFSYEGHALKSGQWLAGVDIKTGDNSLITAPPSRTANGEYRRISLNDTIKEASPELIEMIVSAMKKPVKYSRQPKRKHYEVLTLSDLPDWARVWLNAGLGGQGNRNNAAASLTGRLLRYFSLEIAWNGLLEANRNTQPPLPAREVEAVFKSIATKAKGVNYVRN